MANRQSTQTYNITAKDNATKQFREFIRLKKMAAKTIEAIKTPTEIYARKVRDLKKALDQGLLSQEQFTRAVKKAKEELDAAGKGDAGFGGFANKAAKVLAAVAAAEGVARLMAGAFAAMRGDSEGLVENLKRLPVVGGFVDATNEALGNLTGINQEVAKLKEQVKEIDKATARATEFRRVQEASIARQAQRAARIGAAGLTGLEREEFNVRAKLEMDIDNLKRQLRRDLIKFDNDAQRQSLRNRFDAEVSQLKRLAEIDIDLARQNARQLAQEEEQRAQRQREAERARRQREAVQAEKLFMANVAKSAQPWIQERVAALREQLAAIGRTRAAPARRALDAVQVTGFNRQDAAAFNATQQVQATARAEALRRRNDEERNRLLKKIAETPERIRELVELSMSINDFLSGAIALR